MSPPAGAPTSASAPATKRRRPPPSERPLKLWWAAARPKTLALSWSPIVVGASLAHRAGHPVAAVAVLAALGATAIQVGTNLFNDWGDAARGADGSDRLGPLRVTQAGLLPANLVAAAGVFAFVVATVCGVGLLCAGRLDAATLIAVGLAALAAGFGYTAGPLPLAYHGLGELFAGVFFGPVATSMTFALCSGHFSGPSVGLGVALGAFAASVLLINNVRDAAADVRVAKRTLAVRLGPKRARALLTFLLALPFGVVACLLWRGELPPLAAQALASAPLAWQLARDGWRLEGRALNGLLARTVRLQLLFSAFLALALSW